MTHSFRTSRVATLILFLVICVSGRNVSGGTAIPLKLGDKVSIKTRNENHTSVIGMVPETKRGVFFGCRNDILFVGRRGDIRLDRLVTTDGSVLEYPLVGAKYNSLTQSIIGKDESGNIDSIPITKIDRVDVTLFINDKPFHTGFASKNLRDRLRFVHAYPEVLYEIPFDSIIEIRRWKQGSAIPAFIGIVTGGVVAFYLMEAKRESHFRMNPAVMGVEIVLGSAVGGVIGFLFGRSRWQEAKM